MKPWQLGDGDNTVSTEQLRMEFIFDSINRQLAAIGVTDQTTFDVFANYIGYSTGGTPSYQDMQVAWTPSSVKAGEVFGFFQYVDLPGITGTLIFEQVHMLGGVDIEPGLVGAVGVTGISFPNLIDVDPTGAFSGYFSLIGFPNLVSVSAPNFVTYYSTLAINNNPSLTTVDFSSYLPTNTKGVNFQGDALLVASVDQILARCVANPAYVNGIVDVSGGTNAAPSSVAPGSDTAILIGRGVTVNHN